MQVEYMIDCINNYYGGNWKKIYSMPDNQIVAIYYSMKESGKFDKPKRVPVKLTKQENVQFPIISDEEMQRIINNSKDINKEAIWKL